MARRVPPIAAALSLVACGLASACAVPRQMLAAPDDVADYRAFRLAAREGARLARAQRYLERHPRGEWMEEVRRAFDAEEGAWFEAAKTSRVRARDYLVDLPHGPHADAARALLALFDEHQGDLDTLELLAASRRTAAMLDVESARRKHVTELLLGDLAAMLDPPTWGARLDDAPPLLASVLRGEAPLTWGGAAPAHHDERLFFVVPTPGGAQSRAVDVRFQVWLEDGRVAEAVVQGEELFVRWAEAAQVRVLDPTSASDRQAAADAVSELVGGALEALLPAARCTIPPSPGVILARACDGWTVTVRMGASPGGEDAIDVRGKLFRAPAPGMR